MNCKCKYAVVINMPGYMPDRENTCHRTLADANATVQWEINQFREIDYTVVGSLKERTWYAKPNQPYGGSAYWIKIISINESYGYAESCEYDGCY